MHPGSWLEQQDIEAAAYDAVLAFEDGPMGRWGGRGWNRLVRRYVWKHWPDLYDALEDLSEAMEHAGKHPYR